MNKTSYCLLLKDLQQEKDKKRINISLKNTSLLIEKLIMDCKLFINDKEDMLYTDLLNHFNNQGLAIKHYILARKQGMDFNSYLNSLNVVNVSKTIDNLNIEEVCEI